MMLKTGSTGRTGKAAEAQRQADAWNARYLPGTEVVLTNDLGEEELTRTRSGAWVLPGGQVVAQVVGRSGCYLLSRLRPK